MIVGVKYKFNLFQILITGVFIILSMIIVVFWLLVYGGYENNYMLFNGIEVEAEIVDVICVDKTPDDSLPTYSYESVYYYISPDGKEYTGWGGPSGANKELYIGKKVTIVIDPNSTKSIFGSLTTLAGYEGYIYTYFQLACTFTSMFCIVLYLFIYRVIYRKALDRKMLERLEGRFVNGCVSQGEVTKTRKWIVGYVKVKYKDENGKTKEKWARSWFTRKETKFLEQKKFINIVPYKNTYGIVEEMP